MNKDKGHKLYVGIDVAKETFAAAIWEPQTATARYLGQWANTPAGLTAFTQVLQPPEFGVHLIMEPTGGYEWLLVQLAYQQEWAVSLPNPKRVRDWLKGGGQRAKTDAVDARGLAAYGATQHPTPQQPLPAEVQELDRLLHRQQDLEHLLRQERNRQGSGATWQGLPEAVRTSLAR